MLSKLHGYNRCVHASKDNRLMDRLTVWLPHLEGWPATDLMCLKEKKTCGHSQKLFADEYRRLLEGKMV